ncbi:carbohydrate kinase family protein [Cellulomonas sp. HZM]|uniref:carbohydrate kinase family protein n=1 Tax=Cellulomonas sp. HZM TaxID=1454010 RepID=UPI0004933968|nr:PfkB family carbohydrate kinase [Cellulomonas sp. HZM]
MPHVLVNGAASWNTLVRLPELPEPRPATLFASGLDDGLGGTSAGKAVTLAALGVDVTLATLLGHDDEADLVRTALGPHVRLLAAPARAGRTERHLNLMADDGSRVSIYLELPAAVSPDPPAAVLETLALADVAVLDLAESSRPLLRAARALDVPVWCDVHDDDGTAEYPRAFADAADVLVVSDARLPDPHAYLEARVVGGAALAVCTRGAAGAVAFDGTTWWDVPSAPVDVVDTNGAGDAFVSGLLAATLAGRPTADALAWASAAGAIAVGGRDLGAPHASVQAVVELATTIDVRPA